LGLGLLDGLELAALRHLGDEQLEGETIGIVGGFTVQETWCDVVRLV
jgi:hypothetical protein